MVDRDGQSRLIFSMATFWLNEFKVMLASTSRTASVSSCWKESCTACTAAFIPGICPAERCNILTASFIDDTEEGLGQNASYSFSYTNGLNTWILVHYRS